MSANFRELRLWKYRCRRCLLLPGTSGLHLAHACFTQSGTDLDFFYRVHAVQPIAAPVSASTSTSAQAQAQGQSPLATSTGTTTVERTGSMQPVTPLPLASQRYLSLLDDTQSGNSFFVFIVARRAVARPRARKSIAGVSILAEQTIISMLFRHPYSRRKELMVYLQRAASNRNVRTRNRLRESRYQPRQEIRR